MAPFFTDGVQLPQGYSHFEEAVYFLPLKYGVYVFTESGLEIKMQI